jgi:hypothetical protein
LKGTSRIAAKASRVPGGNRLNLLPGIQSGMKRTVKNIGQKGADGLKD